MPSLTRIPSAAVVDASGKVRALVRPKEPDEEVTEKQVTDVKWLARLLMRVLRDVAALKRRSIVRRIDFEDVVVNGDGVTVYRFVHLFGGRVRWWITDAIGSDGALTRASGTTSDVLMLVSASAGVVTIRIEEVGG